jgi:pantothenate kinase type III
MATETNLFIHIGTRWTQVYYESLQVVETDPAWTLKDVHRLLGDFQFLGAILVNKVVISSHVKELTSVFSAYAKKVLQTDALIIQPKQSMLTLPESTPTDVVAVIHAHAGEVVYLGLQEHVTITYVNDGYFQGFLQGPAISIDLQTEMPPRLHLAKHEEAAMIQGAIVGVIGFIESALRLIRPHQEATLVLYGPLAKWMSPYIEEVHTLDTNALFKGMKHLTQHVE